MSLRHKCQIPLTIKTLQKQQIIKFRVPISNNNEMKNINPSPNF